MDAVKSAALLASKATSLALSVAHEACYGPSNRVPLVKEQENEDEQDEKLDCNCRELSAGEKEAKAILELAKSTKLQNIRNMGRQQNVRMLDEDFDDFVGRTRPSELQVQEPCKDRRSKTHGELKGQGSAREERK